MILVEISNSLKTGLKIENVHRSLFEESITFLQIQKDQHIRLSTKTIGYISISSVGWTIDIDLAVFAKSLTKSVLLWFPKMTATKTKPIKYSQ